MQVVDSEGYLKVKLVGGPVGPFVPYTGATGNVDLGTHSLTARNIIVNHPSGSGVAVSITKGGSGEALTVVKTSGSGNAMSVTGGDVEFGTGFFWDDANLRLGINGTPTSPLEIFYNPTGISNTIGLTLNSGSTGSTLKAIRFTAGTFGELGTFGVNTGSGEFRWATSASYFPTIYSNGAERLRIPITGNVLINTTTDAGFKFDVNGTARVNGSSFFATTSGTLVSGTTTIVNMNYGEVPKTYLTGGTFMNGTVQFPTTLRVIATGGGIQFAQQSAPSPNSILFFGNDSSGVYYGNYGSLPLKFMTSAVTQMTIFGTGNVGINTTTDAGFRLDVNGTARVSGPSIVRVGSTNLSTSLFTIDITQSASIVPGNSVPKGLVVSGIYTDTNVGNNTIYTPLLSVETLITSNISTYSGPSRSLINFSPSMESIGRDANNSTTIINITPSFTFRNLNNLTGLFYNPTFILSGSNNTHRAIHTVTGDVLLGSSSGNVLIGTTTNAGFKFDVNGTARVSGTGNVFTINDSSNSRTFTFNPSYATHLYGGLISHSTSNITLNANIGTDSSFVGIFLGGVAGSRNASARLQIDDTTRGFLPPRMTQTQRNAIASPAIGLEIYQTDATEGKYIYKSSGWTYIG
jgi:hypothetical protein